MTKQEQVLAAYATLANVPYEWVKLSKNAKEWLNQAVSKYDVDDIKDGFRWAKNSYYFGGERFHPNSLLQPEVLVRIMTQGRNEAQKRFRWNAPAYQQAEWMN